MIFVATAPPVDILWAAVNPLVVTAPRPKDRTNPLDTLTIGTLNPGALDHGFVAAVAVTVGVPEIWTSPLDTLTIGTLNPGAEDHGLVAAVEMTVGVPLICMRPLDALRTVTVPLICTNPLDTETIGRLNPGALDHGFVPAVAVTVWTELSVTVPLVNEMG